MGGSGFTGGFGRGYWTRLYARAFFFQDLDGQSLALVSCEIHSIPGALQAKVAWKLRDEELHPPKNQKNDELHLTRDNLIISATHTHQGPGNYYSAKVFNDQASPAPGFDQKLFDFFVDRIALAVRSAAADARNKTASLRLRETDISGLLRNRAPGPFLLNPESIGFLKHAGCAEPFDETCVRAKAVDGRVTLLEIHHDQKRVGLLVFLAAHPEVMAQATTLYQTDFTGLAMLALEKKHGIVAGFFNGAEGDISADWDKRERNRNEALSFAGRLSDQIATALSSGNGNPLENFRFQVASKDLVANPYFDPPFWKGREEYCAVTATAGQPSRRCLSGRPIFGVATVGGAEEGRTTLYDLGWREGWRRPPRGRQGLKVGAFESRILPGLDVTRLIAPVCTYPERFPISLVNIVDPNERSLLSLAVLPAELTFMAGRRVRQSLEKADLNKVTLIGLANDYIDYVTTRQEYAAQAYEGASNIFGPHTADVMEATLVEFVKTPGKLAKPVSRTVKVPSARYYPGTTHDRAEFGPEWLGTDYSDPDEALENLIVDAHDRPYRHWPRFLWCEPSCVGDWTAFQRSVTVRRVAGGTIADDDRGSNILTVHVNRAEGSERDEALTKLRDALMLRPSYAPVPRLKGRKRSWMAIWLPKDPVPGERFVFVVQYSVKDEKGQACEFRYESEPFEANRPMDKALCEKDCDVCED